MSKGTLYKIDNKNNKNKDEIYDKTQTIVSFIISMVIYAFVLIIASKLFKGIYVSSFFYALIAAIILSFLNTTLKPILLFYTMPITISTMGILYPLTNMIILWLCSLIMGDNFVVGGFINLFFISIFISLLKMFLDRMFGMRK